MSTSEELECVVCRCEYSRSERVPRLLHCNHTFCTVCLDKMSHLNGVVRFVTCPFCRWITCTRASMTMTGSLWVNTDIWDRITEEPQEKDLEDLDIPKTDLIESPPPNSKKSSFLSALGKFFDSVFL